MAHALARGVQRWRCVKEEEGRAVQECERRRASTLTWRRQTSRGRGTARDATHPPGRLACTIAARRR